MDKKEVKSDRGKYKVFVMGRREVALQLEWEMILMTTHVLSYFKNLVNSFCKDGGQQKNMKVRLNEEL